MKLSEFTIGLDVMMGRKRYRVTDIGTRTVAVICVSGPHRTARTRLEDDVSRTTYTDYSRAEAQARGHFRGPPYGVPERVFDEDDQRACIRLVDYLFDPAYAADD